GRHSSRGEEWRRARCPGPGWPPSRLRARCITTHGWTFRPAQAFGAILAPAALGALVSTFNDPRERGRAFGVFGSVASGGGALGLILGGVLTEYLSWRWCLYVNLAFAAIAVVGALAYIRGGRPAGSPRMDWPGAALACAAPFAIVFGFSQAATAGWTAALTLGSLL